MVFIRQYFLVIVVVSSETCPLQRTASLVAIGIYCNQLGVVVLLNHHHPSRSV